MVVTALQLGAIFLWVYVYNIVRISLEANCGDVNGSVVSDSSTLKPESFTEPLLSPKEYNTSEDSTDSLPLTTFGGKAKVDYCFFFFYIRHPSGCLC